jgi:hypothetical protein
MTPARLLSSRALLVLGMLLVNECATAQSCDLSQSLFPAHPSDTDTIEIAKYGGYPSGRAVVAIDASGSIIVLPWRQCADQIKHGRADPSEFDKFLAQVAHAIETVRNQPSRPDPSTNSELLEIIIGGRIEGLCLSHVDGVDVDVTLFVKGVTSHYPCVTGELLVFGQELLRFGFDAVEN